MAREIKFDIETTLAPAQVKTALLDFTDNRPNLWPAHPEVVALFVKAASGAADGPGIDRAATGLA